MLPPSQIKKKISKFTLCTLFNTALEVLTKPIRGKKEIEGISKIGIDLAKVYDLYTEKMQNIVKEIKKDLNKQKDILCSQTEKLNDVKTAINPKLIYRFKIFLAKSQLQFCRNWETKLTLKDQNKWRNISYSLIKTQQC